jgi:hypothetical protein
MRPKAMSASNGSAGPMETPMVDKAHCGKCESRKHTPEVSNVP